MLYCLRLGKVMTTRIATKFKSKIHTGFQSAALVLGLAMSGTVAHAADKPHVVMMIWDTTRTDHLSIHGYERDTTPNLKAIAQDGVVFDHAYASGSWTGPSVSSIFTGLFGHNHEVDYATKDWAINLRDEVTTLAEVLQDAGYITALYSNQGVVTKNKGLHQGFDIVGGAGEPMMAERTLELIEKSADQPVFVVAYFANPHAPYEPREEHDLWTDKSGPKVNIIGCGKKVAERGWPEGYVAWCDVNWGKVSLSPAQYGQLEAAYDGELHQNDAELGELWEGLKERGIADSTLFVFTSDHGEGFGDHKGAETWHTLPYDFNQHVPLVMRYPGTFPASRVATKVRSIDIYPTVLDALGLDIQAPINGESLTGLLSGEGEDRTNIGFTHKIGFYRNSQYRFIYSRQHQKFNEIYDINKDAGESTNLAETDEALLKSLRAEVKTFMESTGLDLGEKAGAATDEEHEMLKALGYVE